MKRAIISLGGDGSFEIQEFTLGALDIIYVEYDHPNGGLYPWFFLWRWIGLFGQWKFVQIMAADEKHVRKVLSGIETNTPLDEWLISE